MLSQAMTDIAIYRQQLIKNKEADNSSQEDGWIHSEYELKVFQEYA